MKSFSFKRNVHTNTLRERWKAMADERGVQTNYWASQADSAATITVSIPFSNNISIQRWWIKYLLSKVYENVGEGIFSTNETEK